VRAFLAPDFLLLGVNVSGTLPALTTKKIMTAVQYTNKGDPAQVKLNESLNI